VRPLALLVRRLLSVAIAPLASLDRRISLSFPRKSV
jgi:hypothetical protein